MATRLYVGNLNFRTSEDALRELFEEYGAVTNVSIIKDRETDRSRGFAFVEMDADDGAKEAMEALNGQEFDGRTLTVNEARPRAPRTGGGGQRHRRW